MQLTLPKRRSALRARLSTAACMLLAAATPAVGHAEDTTPTTQLEVSSLLYGENQRTTIFEPAVRATRLFSNGQSLSAEIQVDAMTGASPSGAVATNQVQTTTSASGTSQSVAAGVLPTNYFQDLRGSLDADWSLPVGSLFTAASSVHVSKEKDYRSFGGSESFSLDLFQRLVTITAAASFNHDQVTPVGGTAIGLSDGTTMLNFGSNPKRVSSGMLGISRILTRRWMMGVSGTREIEKGYLTEPYKVVSVFSPINTPGEDEPAGSGSTTTLREKRPDLRTRTSGSLSSVYHLTDDILYSSYRYYWDDWGVRSHTLDFKVRHDLPNHAFVQPHVRLYAQTAADFFRFELLQGDPLPAFASSDQRLGPLRTATLGATYGFRIPNAPGHWAVRGEYIRQWGNGHPDYAPSVQHDINLLPGVNTGTLLVTYSIGF